ncbi:hypothetical protein A5753_22905 [Mycobacterium sp. 852002-51971_SCH5477799-a]|uniref:cytochrome P450 n=1 Tax=Mycobacterium sp. 852002-51971_SCH5477799-a TaxID=1834106 RepID=UPI0007FDE01D|nr:cytochrome P450 [Mycobacterium sp. 852002-51971_SCH5477799-a]OBF68586.1 hypothetical protein A5753_22905 [Mycobacterium sp. 852002-51971_SCH5477799-a]
MGIVAPIAEARRAEPRDDLVSMLVTEEYADDDGSRHRLSDGEVQLFSLLLLAAGSGTTWKQSFITMLTLLQRPDWLARLTADPTLVRGFVGETVRWMPIDPAFARFATRDTERCQGSRLLSRRCASPNQRRWGKWQSGAAIGRSG